MERSVSISTDESLQLGILQNVTLVRRCFLHFAIKLMVPNTPDTLDFWLENKIFSNSFCVFIIISDAFYLFHFLSLHKLLLYSSFIYILYDECRENVRGEYSLVEYIIRNQKTLKIVYVFKKPSEITLDKKFL